MYKQMWLSKQILGTPLQLWRRVNLSKYWPLDRGHENK